MDPSSTDQTNPAAGSSPHPTPEPHTQWQYPQVTTPTTDQSPQPPVSSPQPVAPAADPTYQAYVEHYYQQWQQQDPVGYQAYLQAYQQHQNALLAAAPPATPPPLAHQPVEPQGNVQTYQLPPADANTQYSQYTPEPAAPTAAVTAPPQPKAEPKPKKLPSRFKPLLSAALVGMLIFGLFNSQIIVGQLKYLISPQADAQEAGISDSETVGAESSVVIPKINVNAPVVYDEPSFEESKIQKALERGVVHYGNTAVPGQLGNVVIVGHSSNNWWASGKYKFAFVLLDKLDVGDTFSLHYQGKRYVYQITQKKVIDPKDVSVLNQNSSEPLATLITCTPPGTSLHRLYVQGKQISPDPAQDGPAVSNGLPQGELLPGNTPSLWEQFKRRFFGG